MLRMFNDVVLALLTQKKVSKTISSDAKSSITNGGTSLLNDINRCPPVDRGTMEDDEFTCEYAKH